MDLTTSIYSQNTCKRLLKQFKSTGEYRVKVDEILRNYFDIRRIFHTVKITDKILNPIIEKGNA